MDQQQDLEFIQENLHRGVQICLLSWPTLKHALSSSWISENKNLNNNARIASFKKMSSHDLTYALISQLETYIMKHQVQVQHLEDWFQELMDEVFCADVEDVFIKVMAQQLVDLVSDLEDGNTTKIKQFQDAYEKMKNGKLNINRIAGNESDSSEAQDEQDDEEQQDGEGHEQKKQQQPPALVSVPELTQQQQALQDDGWTIVGKKKK